MPEKEISGTQFGPLLTDRGVTFRMWAPAAHEVDLVLDRKISMGKNGEWFVLNVPHAQSGTRYRFRIDDDIEIPDPASHFQPEDVRGPSEVIDHRHQWQCSDWKGRPWHEAIFLEAHVGTFTPEGTFRAMIERLDHIAATGITALELMPVSDFPSRWNWGYDGVLLFAPDSSYGRPEDLKMLIDVAHARGLMVFLDVVYNHFGPEGNYLGRIAPRIFTQAQTPWGTAIDYRVPEVRGFAIENALHWVREYRFDGLRLDAVHAIVTRGEPDILTDLSRAVGAFARASGRHIHLVLENDDNSASLLAPDEDPPMGHYRAQWNDDYHHAWHVLLTGDGQGYYRDYGHPRHFVRSLSQGFAYQGEPSRHRGGRPRGEPSRHLPPAAFVNFLQNHDQIGNRPLGERLTVLAKPDALAAALSVLLLQPSPPLLFMGEEWGATEPFPFFCDFKGKLAEAVRDGRKREFAEAYARLDGEIPDPIAPSTRAGAILNWEAITRPEHARRLALTRSLLDVRKRAIVPLLAAIRDSEVSFDDGILSARWPAGSKVLKLLANLTDVALPRERMNWGEPIWEGEPPRELPPWSVYAAIGDA
jgi:maltooligosyltrehalose trehalohydrolase